MIRFPRFTFVFICIWAVIGIAYTVRSVTAGEAPPSPEQRIEKLESQVVDLMRSVRFMSKDISNLQGENRKLKVENELILRLPTVNREYKILMAHIRAHERDR